MLLFFTFLPGTATAHTHKFVSVQHKKNIWETFSYPKHAFRPRRRLNWRQRLISINSCVYSIKKQNKTKQNKTKQNKTFEGQAYITNMRFVREEAYSGSYWLIWRLLRPRLHYVPQISCTTWCKIQTFGFVNASILLIKIRDEKFRER